MRSDSPSTDNRAPGPFFATPSQRVALARERFFEEGHRPSGLVPEGVIQSWTRCVGAHRAPQERVAFDPLTRSRVSQTLARNRQLLEASTADIVQLEAMLAGTACKAILTDRHGIVVHATRMAPSDGGMVRLLGRVGVDLGEEAAGTTAPGVTSKTGVICTVQGAEHFFSGIHAMHCAAAPIRDMHGELAGVLDLSCEAEPFRFDAAAIVSLYATAIENRLLVAQSSQHVLLQFHAAAGLLGTPMQGLAAIGGDGRVAWVNGAGSTLLAARRTPDVEATVESAFGLDMHSLLGLVRRREASPHRLPNGLLLWMQARLQARDGIASALMTGRETDPAFADVATMPVDATPPAPGPRARRAELAGSGSRIDAGPDADSDAGQASLEAFTGTSATTADATPNGRRLHDANQYLIEQTLAECGGNITRAARKLGVSRGLLYRRLKAQPPR